MARRVRRVPSGRCEDTDDVSLVYPVVLDEEEVLVRGTVSLDCSLPV